MAESSVLLSAQKVPLVSPSLTLLFGNSIHGSPSSTSEIAQLPTRLEAEILYQRYLESVNPIVHVLHIPSFRRLLESFWTNIDLGHANSESSVALVLSVCTAAAASITTIQSKAHFGLSQEDLFRRLQTATEQALVRAKWSKTTNIQTLQALTIYLVILLLATLNSLRC